ncbi:MAG: energy-coupling factor transporter transmembrane protein EcfT [Clostridiales bacterium]|nr:energy-coupling factor transporter transmembrane protein EcfT [Clostridiales bacterium]
MMSDITLGQFFPGNSILHKIDPRVKIILSIAYIVSVFLSSSAASYILLFAFTMLIVFISGIKAKVIFKSVRPLVLVIILTSLINIFFTTGKTPLIDWRFIHIYAEGIVSAVFMVVRITCLLIGTSVLLTYTTSPIMLTDAIERLLSPLGYIKIPVHEFAMMMTIALRFIPTLIEETDKIMSAQKARGADFESGKLTERAKALVPVLIPLFISSFRRADELAVAMECRCYRGGNGRTKMTKLTLRYYDFLSLLMCAVFIAALVMISKIYPIYSLV